MEAERLIRSGSSPRVVEVLSNVVDWDDQAAISAADSSVV
jgi:hypothetical protein